MRRDKAARLLERELEELDAIIDRTQQEFDEYRAETDTQAGQVSQHPAEHGSDVTAVMEQELSIDTVRARREEVLAAKDRLESDTFGVCVDCGKKIPNERLEALPWATRCVEDQEKADHRIHH